MGEIDVDHEKSLKIGLHSRLSVELTDGVALGSYFDAIVRRKRDLKADCCTCWNTTRHRGRFSCG
jgi:hypothetical protein